MRTFLLSLLVAGAAAVGFASPAAAQEQGCCQFAPRSADGGVHRGTRRCEDMTREACLLLKPVSTFFARWTCDARAARCVIGSQAVPTPTPTPTATPHVERMGCCQLNQLRRAGDSVCGNQISETSCFNDFAGQPSFCADCVCSSHAGGGFTLDRGTCVTPRPTPTGTPEPQGCCQVDGSPGVGGPICGNAIRQSSCLHDFGGQPSFCADCVCSVNTGSESSFARGTCVSQRSGAHHPRGPHPRH